MQSWIPGFLWLNLSSNVWSKFKYDFLTFISWIVSWGLSFGSSTRSYHRLQTISSSISFLIISYYFLSFIHFRCGWTWIPWQVSSVQHERCNDFLSVTSLVSQKLSHPWLRGSQRPDNKTLSTSFLPASWVGPYLVTLVGLRPPSLLVPLPTRVAAPPAGKGRGT